MLRIILSLYLGFICISASAQTAEPEGVIQPQKAVEGTIDGTIEGVNEGANKDSNKQSPEQRLPLRELRLFTQVFEQIRQGYVEEVSDTQLLENAIAGLRMLEDR